MNRKSLLPLAATAALLAGCSLFRWSGSSDQELSDKWVWSTEDLVISTETARSRPPAPFHPENLPDTLYYEDLGPDTIAVAGYPAQQRYNYGLFTQECSRCHTLARAINSPVESGVYWRFHLARMSLHSRLRRQGPIHGAEAKAILDFLEYDAQVRKVQGRKQFDAQTEELKRRFEPILNNLLEQMRRSGHPSLGRDDDRAW